LFLTDCLTNSIQFLKDCGGLSGDAKVEDSEHRSQPSSSQPGSYLAKHNVEETTKAGRSRVAK